MKAYVKSRNLHVYFRNHHNKHAIALYTLMECGVQHNNSRRRQNYSLLVMKHLTEYARFSSDKHLILNTFKNIRKIEINLSIQKIDK